MNKSSLVLIKRVVGKVARANRLTPNAPLPVFDSTGDLIGVSLSTDKTIDEMDCIALSLSGPKQMGNMACTATATFTVSAKANEATIQAKAEAAANAIKQEILVTIRPKTVERKSA